jgi:hypothetical protein
VTAAMFAPCTNITVAARQIAQLEHLPVDLNREGFTKL